MDENLKKEQEKTLGTEVMRPNFILRIAVVAFDILYGKKRTLPKFRVLEILARYPYTAWENGAYHVVTSAFCSSVSGEKKDKVEYVLRHIAMGRKAQDNEQWHLVLLDEQIKNLGIKQGFFRHKIIPPLLTFGYYWLTRFMYRVRPSWSFHMNAAFESHAEHEYMKMAKENPDWENMKIQSEYFNYYPECQSLSDLIRRIGLDEREHMEESLEECRRLANSGS
ncbi:MAG: alternative oxidase [Fibrobacterota bacterium]